jgi:hypothetical protein
MVDEGEIKASNHAYNLKVFCLPKTTLLKDTKLKHELLCGDLYVVLELTGKLPYWNEPQEADEFGIKPDRRMIYDGKIVFWEVDRGTEDYYTEKGIQGKIERYIKLSQSDRDKRFHVCFTTITQYDNFGKIKCTAENRAETILNLIYSYARGDQFMVTTHNWAINHIEFAPFMTFSNPMGVSISEAK